MQSFPEAGANVVLSMAKQLTCPLCKCIFENAHTLPCQHHFCRECVEDESASGSCPVCRNPYYPKDVHRNTSITSMTHTFLELYSAVSQARPLPSLARRNKLPSPPRAVSAVTEQVKPAPAAAAPLALSESMPASTSSSALRDSTNRAALDEEEPTIAVSALPSALTAKKYGRNSKSVPATAAVAGASNTTSSASSALFDSLRSAGQPASSTRTLTSQDMVVDQPPSAVLEQMVVLETQSQDKDVFDFPNSSQPKGSTLVKPAKRSTTADRKSAAAAAAKVTSNSKAPAEAQSKRVQKPVDEPPVVTAATPVEPLDSSSTKPANKRKVAKRTPAVSMETASEPPAVMDVTLNATLSIDANQPPVAAVVVSSPDKSKTGPSATVGPTGLTPQAKKGSSLDLPLSLSSVDDTHEEDDDSDLIALGTQEKKEFENEVVPSMKKIIAHLRGTKATPAERKACKTELRTMYRMYKHLCGELAADLADVLGSGWDVAEPSNSLSPMSELTSPAATSVTKAAAASTAKSSPGAVADAKHPQVCSVDSAGASTADARPTARALLPEFTSQASSARATASPPPESKSNTNSTTIAPPSPSAAPGRSQMIAPVICPTGLLPAALDAMKKLCARIGGTVISAYNENVTHVVTKADRSQRFSPLRRSPTSVAASASTVSGSPSASGAAPALLASRTIKVVFGVLGGKHIVNLDWITASEAAGYWVDETAFEVSGDTCVLKPRIARNDPSVLLKPQRLFAGYTLITQGPYGPKHPQVHELQEVIRMGGGTAVDSVEAAERLWKSPTPSARPDPSKCFVLVPRDIDVADRTALSFRIGSYARLVSLVWALDCVSALDVLDPAHYPVGQ